ncbi:hypothetical protein LDENG_00018290 [Lucifuga dentata]|nr:hypothetical protein LDENG_00018290 [Lucifuga dentata]
MEDIGKDISDKLIADLSAAPCFSIAVDESTNLTDIAHRAVQRLSSLCFHPPRFPKEDSFREDDKITILYIPDKELLHFPKLRALTTTDPSLLQHFSHRMLVEVLEELREEFETRFSDITEYKDVLNFVENPFHVDVSSLIPAITKLCPASRSTLESEIVELQANDILKAELRAGVGHFWSLVLESDFPTLKPFALKVMSFFVSTYTCESTFSAMNTIKRKQINRLSNTHLDCLTRIATSYRYNMTKVKETNAHFIIYILVYYM